jgi:hypothetical protein
MDLTSEKEQLLLLIIVTLFTAALSELVYFYARTSAIFVAKNKI